MDWFRCAIEYVVADYGKNYYANLFYIKLCCNYFQSLSSSCDVKGEHVLPRNKQWHSGVLCVQSIKGFKIETHMKKISFFVSLVSVELGIHLLFKIAALEASMLHTLGIVVINIMVHEFFGKIFLHQ